MLQLRNNLEVRCAILGLYHYGCAYFTWFPWTPRLYSIPDIRYEREDEGLTARLERYWRVVPMIVHARKADCKGLASYRAAEKTIAEGIPSEPLLLEFPGLLHVIVKSLEPDGRTTFEDPSLILGMPAPPGYVELMAQLKGQSWR